MALTIEREVRCSIDIVLIDATKLSGHAITFVNVQYARWLTERRRLILRHTQKRRGLACIVTAREVVGVVAAERRIHDFVEFEVRNIKFEAHELLGAMVHVKVD